MLPACRTESQSLPFPRLTRRPVMWKASWTNSGSSSWPFTTVFHAVRRAHFFDYMVGQFSQLERKSIEPMALHVQGRTIRGLQRFISHVYIVS
jgi:hypothetical protein